MITILFPMDDFIAKWDKIVKIMGKQDKIIIRQRRSN